jgi:hypothetical protein
MSPSQYSYGIRKVTPVECNKYEYVLFRINILFSILGQFSYNVSHNNFINSVFMASEILQQRNTIWFNWQSQPAWSIYKTFIEIHESRFLHAS